ncbi:methylisocitrate lyase [Rhodobacteraceae bacterium RKSG542]|uniref:methylisocitrate lyase n=1 Tax=Pseudovibrio flavus TaxID=2529854 RepID=UPI0012BB90F8|nr:methylisocitrate lyase [Pseudovibrio flavus]MTI17524.1 methylisocitrate lyase [Pseudovibrio flavus]
MLRQKRNPHEKRKQLRKAIASQSIVRAPGAFSPLVAMEIERQGFEALYISGAVISADLGLPDIALTTLSEVADRAEQIAQATNLPTIVDCDTGFGEPMNAARTMHIMESRGQSALQLEDQLAPKRCGQLDGKTLVSTEEMIQRIKASVDARQDPETVIIARTDAFATEGMDGAMARAAAYVKAGADVIFVEALKTPAEWQEAAERTPAPILANMTEFGKSELLSAAELEKLGASIVIYPVTLLRLAMKAAVQGLSEIAENGTQKAILDQMQTREELYGLLGYADYNQLDQSIFNFKITSGGT